MDAQRKSVKIQGHKKELFIPKSKIIDFVENIFSYCLILNM